MRILSEVPITTPSQVWEMFRTRALRWDREHFLILALNGRHQVIGYDLVSIGTLMASLVHPREVFKPLILANALAFILVHNHPSGDPSPSSEDEALTRKLKEAGDILGIKLLDHVVLGHDRFYSMSSKGLL